MQHPGGVGGFGWSSWSGGGVGKTCQGGVGAVACGRGRRGGALAPRPNCHNLHLKCPSPIPIPTPPIPKAHPQSPSPMPIPNPHTHPSPQCPSPILIPIPKPNSRCPSQLPIPNAHPQSPSRISASCRVGGGMENLMDFCCHTGGLARGCHAVLRGGCRLGQPPSAQEGGMEAGCHAPNHPPLGSGGGWQPSVIRQRGGVGLLNVHLCAWGWGWRASVMQHPGGFGGFGYIEGRT